MNAYLLDTNILLREANTSDVKHTLVHTALTTLHLSGVILYLTPQVLIEFRNVATRPVQYNGLGMSASEVESETERFKRIFPLLPETTIIFPAWELIVKTNAVIGKQVHDARLVAVCKAAGIDHLLTFNVQDFKRYEPALVSVSPEDV